MKRVLFHVEFSSQVEIDFSQLETGNPGIGGTQYATLCLAVEIAKFSHFEVGIVSSINLNVPKEITFVKQKSLVDAINFAEKEESILVFRPTINLEKDIERAINGSNANLVAWAHVNPSQATLRKLANARSVKRVVALGGRQFMTWIDNPVKNKTQVIKNGQYLPKNSLHMNSPIKYVSYLGSIVPQKGFHLLAKAWPEIHEKFPQLRLKVIGSGALYHAKTKLGKYGIAEQQYEDLFIENFGSSITSVDFLGKINAVEKNHVVANSYIGIVNPSGNTENCPASALDYQAYNVPVISVFKLGLIDTVQHRQTGILVRNYKKIPEAVGMLIENENFRNQLSSNCRYFLEHEFSFDKIVKEWMQLFNSLNSESKISVHRSDLVSFREYISYLYAKYVINLFEHKNLKSTYEIESILRSFLRRLLKLQ